jgi:hypothetical protein
MFLARLAYCWAVMVEVLDVEFVLLVEVIVPVYSSTPNEVKCVVMQFTSVVESC